MRNRRAVIGAFLVTLTVLLSAVGLLAVGERTANRLAGQTPVITVPEPPESLFSPALRVMMPPGWQALLLLAEGERRLLPITTEQMWLYWKNQRGIS